MAKKTKKAAPQSRETASIKSFLDMIAPSVVKFEPDHFICGNTFRCVWALREYPTQTDEQARYSKTLCVGQFLSRSKFDEISQSNLRFPLA